LDITEAQAMLSECLYERGQPVVVHNWLPSSSGVEVDGIDDPLETRILSSDCTNGISECLAESCCRQSDGRPTTRWRNVEPDESVVLVNDLLRGVEVPNLVCDSLDLVVEDVRKSLEEDQRKNVVLEFRSVERTTNLASGVPEPRLQRLDVERAAQA
jgi:hypothetical protein